MIRNAILLVFSVLPVSGFALATGTLSDPGPLPVLHDSLKQEYGIDLYSMPFWKFKSGDDLAWAGRTLDESDWLPIASLEKLPDSLLTGIGWFRLTIKVDSSFSPGHYFAELHARGGATLFINGDEAVSKGKPSAAPEGEVLDWSFDVVKNSVPIDLEPGSTVVLAVRYSYHQRAFFRVFETSSRARAVQFSLRILNLKQIQEASEAARLFSAILMVAVVFLTMVLALHLFMFLRFKDEKGNFWVVVTTTAILLDIGLFTLRDFNLVSISVSAISDYVSPVLEVLPVTLIPVTLAGLLGITISRYWFFLPFSAVLNLFASRLLLDFTGDGNTTDITIMSLYLSPSIWFIYRMRRGLDRSKRRYSWILTTSLLTYPVIFAGGLILLSVFEPANYTVFMAALFALLYISLPLGFSIYQSVRFFNAQVNLKQEVAIQTAELQQSRNHLADSLHRLEATQSQLIQQEKLASLGQLTAGIAHEIKNPLNFVNNFASVSVEMLSELKESVETLKSGSNAGTAVRPEDWEEVEALTGDLQTNLEKIQVHGIRADKIIKSMLLHSRGGSGEKEPTDVNELVREYANLAFHGMRAAKKPINVEVRYDLDAAAGSVAMVAEDISRVIVNLCNNAFDAMRDAGTTSPVLTLRTRRTEKSLQIDVEDNGPGIPEDIKARILEPFFTTKKGTEGTGLGLSISNDIVHAHNGRLEVASGAGGARFTLVFPVV